jgi:uncharacterized protein YfiM (DUF2279 family)
MTKPIILAVSLSLSTGGQWWGADKVKHFMMGWLVQSVTHTTLQVAGVRPPVAQAVASAATVTAAVGREVHDGRVGRTPDPRDIVWTVGGGAAAALLLQRAAPPR